MLSRRPSERSLFSLHSRWQYVVATEGSLDTAGLVDSRQAKRQRLDGPDPKCGVSIEVWEDIFSQKSTSHPHTCPSTHADDR